LKPERRGPPSSGAGARAQIPGQARFPLCLNTSTVRGQGLTIEEEIDLAADAGYDGIEPWFRNIEQFTAGGGKLADLRKRIEDRGLTVESAIGFASWIVDDDAKRAEGFETAKRDMDTLAQIGGGRLAAPPAGTREAVDLDRAAERYRQLLELGATMGVSPQVEMWGGHPAIGTVEKALYIALRADHPNACFLGDVFHTYKGGCGFEGFRLLSPRAVQVFHVNDYPANPPQAQIRDEHRVYPGDGVAPIVDLLRMFADNGAYPALSLELFNREYWKRPADEVAQTGLAKMKEVVRQAMT